MFCDKDDTSYFETIRDTSEELLSAVINASPDCFKLVDLDGRLEFMNKAGAEIMEIDDRTLVLGQIWSALWPEDSRAMVEGAVEYALKGRRSTFRALCPTAKGRQAHWDVIVTPVYGADNRIVRLLCVSRDVSRIIELERALDARESQHGLRCVTAA